MSSPPIHRRDTPFWRFIHKPKDPVALKDVSDILKNYALVGGLYAVAYKLSNNAEFKFAISGYVLYGITFVFGAWCFLQVLVSGLKGFEQIWPMPDYVQYQNEKSARFRLWLFLLLPLALTYLSIAIAMWMVGNGVG